MTKRLFTAAGYGVVTSLIIILAMALILSSLLKLSSLSEASIDKIPLIISLVALFIGGITAGVKLKERGLMIGAVTGILYSVIISLYLFLGVNMGLSPEQYLLFGANIIVTALGGVLGVNLFVRGRIK
ncbi:TIGR04086 family membrane protein [Tuberibacillus sp. Marseille-P3662]|uniref:TIGR04086 family membrane protein n=1 Tax=Tuberibacillus sp. Marseille-P3662 TaxID=1965358 RepID=UPI0015936FCC|nr:TIGR04086 family membrane protein [Tuberibacillus sp. Marseille-P3662]